MKPVHEWRTMDAATFREKVRPANRPAVFRGLTHHWPAVVAGSSAAADLTNYLEGFDQDGSVVETLIGSPDIEGSSSTAKTWPVLTSLARSSALPGYFGNSPALQVSGGHPQLRFKALRSIKPCPGSLQKTAWIFSA
jgi:hypothetical protein